MKRAMRSAPLTLFGLLLLQANVTLWADEITDALLNTDPTARYSSGTGASYHSIYGPQDSNPLPVEATDPFLDDPLANPYRSLGDHYRGFRSPLNLPEQADAEPILDVDVPELKIPPAPYSQKEFEKPTVPEPTYPTDSWDY